MSSKAGSGLNVWRKYIAENAQCGVTLDDNVSAPAGTYIFQILLTGEESLFTFDCLVGKSFSFDSVFTFKTKIISVSQAEVYRNDTLLGTWGIVYNDTTKSFYVRNFTTDIGATAVLKSKFNFTIAGLKKTLLEFVVSDDSSTYPSNGMHTDGYYYELLGSVSSTNAMSLSDNALAAVQLNYREQIVEEVNDNNGF